MSVIRHGDEHGASQAIEYGEELAMLAASAAEFAAAHSGFDAVRERMGTEQGYAPALFAETARLGWTGVALPETYGGAGLGPLALVSLFEPLGRSLYGSPLLATTLAGSLVDRAGSKAQKERWLPGLASGDAIGTVALTEADGSWALERPTLAAERTGDGYRLRGTKHLVLDAGAADWLVVSALLEGEPALFVVERASLGEGAVRRHVLVDEVRRACRVDFEGVAVGWDARLEEADAARALARTALEGALLVTAETSGGLAGVIALTVEYLRTRKQFGRPIGSYQALKHPMVEILLAYEQGRSLLYGAATALEQGRADAEAAVRMAKAACGEAFVHAADRAIQFHGGYGFTWECHAQLFLRRALWAEATFGDAAHHRRHLASLLLDGETRSSA